MNSLNSVLIEGNLTADPEKGFSPGGSVLCTFTIESTRYYARDGEKKSEISYFDIEAWNKTAELCLGTLSNGRCVRVIGRLKQDRLEILGGPFSKVKIVAESVEFRPKFDIKPSEIEAEL